MASTFRRRWRTTNGNKYVCATGTNIKIFWEGYEFSCGHLAFHFNPDERIGLPGVLFTLEKYGPVMLIFWWRKDCKEPIYLVTNSEFLFYLLITVFIN